MRCLFVLFQKCLMFFILLKEWKASPDLARDWERNSWATISSLQQRFRFESTSDLLFHILLGWRKCQMIRFGRFWKVVWKQGCDSFLILYSFFHSYRLQALYVVEHMYGKRSSLSQKLTGSHAWELGKLYTGNMCNTNVSVIKNVLTFKAIHLLSI